MRHTPARHSAVKPVLPTLCGTHEPPSSEARFRPTTASFSSYRICSAGVSILSAAQLTSRICESPTKITPANFSRTSLNRANDSPAVPASRQSNPASGCRMSLRARFTLPPHLFLVTP